MKILHVIADLDARKGGPAAVCVGMAKLMSRRGHEVRIVTTDRGFVAEHWPKMDRVQIDPLPGSWPAVFATSWPMARRLHSLMADVDVVHVHALYLFHDWAVSRYSRRFGKPYILMPHGALDPFIYSRHRWRKSIVECAFQNEMARRAAGLHYTTIEEWKLARPHVSNLRGAILSIGVDLDDVAHLPPPQMLRARYPMIGDRKVVLFLGRLSYKKGIDIVIRAFAEVAKQRDDVFLVLAGPDDGVRRASEALIAQCGIAERSIFTGMTLGEEKRIVLGGSDIFILPSHSENFGITVAEAAASGIPVVISDQVNIWRDFHDAQAGLTAPPTVADFTEHLKVLLENPKRAVELGQRGAELVRRRFSWDILGCRYEEMYSTVVRGGTLPELV